MDTIKVLIADDHPVVRKGISAALQREADLEVVGQARNGREAIERAAALAPDIVLMDLRMPEVDGIEAMRTIRAQNPKIKFIILTTYQSDEYLFQGIKAGALAYLLKDCTVEELLKATRAVHEGQLLLRAPSAAKEVEDGNPSLAMGPPQKTLSPREIEVLRLAAQGMSGKRMAAHLSISESTVKVHMACVFRKLKVKNRPEAVAEAMRRKILQL